MNRRTLLPLIALLAGCGGGGSTNFLEASSGTVNLTFTSGDDYNGSSAAWTASDSFNGSAGTSFISAEGVKDDRSISLSLSGSALAAGTVIDFADTVGSSITYVDDAGRWTPVSGTATITTRTASTIVVTLSNVVLTASGSGATGTVALSGTVGFTGS